MVVLVLALDTATSAVVVGVASVDPDPEPGAGPDPGPRSGAVRVLAERVVVDGRRHAELLAPGIVECLRRAGVTARDLSAVVAGVGPGPFTGLRVGLVTALALADALDLPAYGVCSLDAVAAAGDAAARDGAVAGDGAGDGVVGGAPAAGDGASLLVATDARRREVYWALYDGAGARLTAPAVDRPAVVASRLASRLASRVAARPGHGAVRARGAGAVLYADVLGLPVTGPDRPSVAALVGLAAARVRGAAPGEPLTPLYLRRPDAVPSAGATAGATAAAAVTGAAP